MVSIVSDPNDASKIVLSVTATIYLDRLLVETLSSELETAIRSQAVRDLRKNKIVQAAVAEAATAKLLKILEAGLSKQEGL